MAKKKSSTKETKKKVEKNVDAVEDIKYKKGDIIYVPYKELPGTTLGAVYEFKGNLVRLCCINNISKLVVE